MWVMATCQRKGIPSPKVTRCPPSLLLVPSIPLFFCKEYFTGRNPESDCVFTLPDPQSTARFSASQEIASFIFNNFLCMSLLPCYYTVWFQFYIIQICFT